MSTHQFYHTFVLFLFMHAAGYNVVIVESVGLGQSEVEIDNAVDMLVMIVPPGGGDGLQVRHCSHVHLLIFILFLSLVSFYPFYLCNLT